MYKRICMGVLVVCMLMMMSCDDNGAAGNEKPEFVSVGKNGSRTDDAIGFQFELPLDGEEIAVLNTNMGEIKIRLFPESAPIAVENFKQLIAKGYYDGVVFHRIIENFMIQGGDPTGTGTGGDTAWGDDGFEYEFNANLLHFKGAVSMAHSSLPASNSSQFFIVQAGPGSVSESLGVDTSQYLDGTVDLYLEHGGTPWLDGVVNQSGHTVFGQVFEGLDVVDMIAQVQVGSSGKPVEDVVIESARLVQYTS